jgi:beta propeller repeat protein
MHPEGIMRASRTLTITALVSASLCLPAPAQPPFQAFLVSSTMSPERFPKTDGRFVVWTDVAYLGGPPGSTNDVYAYDLQLGQRIPVATSSAQEDGPAVSDGVVVFNVSNPGSPNIFGKNLALGGASFTVTSAPGSQSAAEISGNLVVWHDNRNGSPEQIWGRKLDQPVGSDFAISSTNATYQQIFPDVSGNVAVWMTQNENGDQGNIYGRDVNSGGVFPITTNSAYQYFPQISGRTVVWNDTRDGTVHVYGRNLDSGGDVLISSGVSAQYLVAFDGDLVVWRDDRAGNSDLWGRYLSSGGEFQITNTPNIYEDYPQVSGNVVVWEQSTGDGFDTGIWATYIPEPALGCFLPIILGMTMSIRRR